MVEDLLVLLVCVFAFGTPVGVGVFLKYKAKKGKISPTCKTCKHFDKEEWEQAKRALPAFDEASRWVSPNDMGRPKEEGDDTPVENLNLKQNHWDRFAVCVQPDSPNYAKGIHEDDICTHWEPRDHV